jgi:hypothetical protein
MVSSKAWASCAAAADATCEFCAEAKPESGKAAETSKVVCAEARTFWCLKWRKYFGNPILSRIENLNSYTKYRRNILNYSLILLDM